MDRAVYTVANATDRSVQMIATSLPYWGLRSCDTGELAVMQLRGVG